MKSRWLLTVVAFSLFLSAFGASPWDSWRHGYIAYEQGEQLVEKGNYTEALVQFRESKKHYLAVRSARPDWNQRVIAERIADCDAKIQEISARLGDKKSGSKANVVVPAVSAAKKDGNAGSAGSGTSSSPEEELEKLRRQVRILEAEVSVFKKRVEQQGTLENEIAGLVRDKRIASEKYALLEQRYQKLRDEAVAPEREVATLKSRLVEEMMRIETAERNLRVTEQRLRELQEENKNNKLARNAEEKLRQKTEDECVRLRKRIDDLAAEAARNREVSAEAARSTAADEKQLNEMAAALHDSLQKANNRIAKLEEDNHRLRQEKASSAEDARLSKAEAVRFRDRNAILERDVKQLFERCETLTKRLAARESEEFRMAAAAKEERRRLEQQMLQLQNELVKYRTNADLKQAYGQELERKNKAMDAELLTLRSSLAAATKRCAELSAELEKLKDVSRQYQELQRNFNALSAENRENKALAAAAKPREAELAKIKLRLLESDRLRAELVQEQRLNEELKKEHLRIVADLSTMRSQIKELDRLRRRNAELEPVLQEVERLKRLQSSYQTLQGREAELAALKIKFVEVENQLRSAQESLKDSTAENSSLKERNRALENEKRSLARFKSVNAELQTLTQSQSSEIDRLNTALKRQKKTQEEAAQAGIAAATDKVRRECESRSAQLVRDKEVALNQNLRKVEQEKQTLQQKVNELQAALSVHQKDSTVQEMLQKAQQHSTAEITLLRQEIEKLNRKSAEWEQKYSQSAMQNRQKNEKLQELQSALQQQQESSAEQKDSLAQLERTNRQLHHKINQLQDELSHASQLLKTNLSLFQRQQAASEKRFQAVEQKASLKEKEISELQKLNRDLADYRNNSADKLRQIADESARLKLEEELKSLSELNAKLSAERDMLALRLSAARNGIETEGTVQSKRSPEELSADGLAAERHGNTELALWNYRQALETAPNFHPAHQRIGIILSGRGDYKAALPHLSVAYAASTGNVELALLTARCQIALKRFGSAKAILEPLLQKQPESWQLQLLSGLAEAGAGRFALAEEKILLASRLKPEAAEPYLELARLLAHSISDRSGEAVLAYEKARMRGNPPDPELEKLLGSMLDHRRDLIRFLSGAAGEAEVGSDWQAAAWYYRKLIDLKRLEYVPRLALAQFRQGKTSAARETLEFNPPSRLSMAVASLIDLESGDVEGALRHAGQAAGAKLPEDWIGMKLELEKLVRGKQSPAVKALLAAFQR